MTPIRIAALTFPILLIAFWYTAVFFGITTRLGPHPTAAVTSFALLLAPYWFFGFGVAKFLQSKLAQPYQRIAAASLFLLPYLAFSLPRGELNTTLCAELLLTILALIAWLEFVPSTWADYAALFAVALIVEKHVFAAAWTIPGLSGLEKFLIVDVMLYAYLVVRPVVEIGFDFRARLHDFAVGLREFAFYTPIALTLGFSLGFLHLHKIAGSPAWLGAGWLFTLFFVALPEEIFFRGLLLNLLEKSLGTRGALLLSSAIFGLAHFNKRAVFNWRYVILAAIAGIFYGRAYLANRRVLSSGITHATVDTIWSIWLR